MTATTKPLHVGINCLLGGVNESGRRGGRGDHRGTVEGRDRESDRSGVQEAERGSGS